MRDLASKAEFYELSRRMITGNRLRQWAWEEFQALYQQNKLPPVIGIRYKDGVRRPATGLYPLAKAYDMGKTLLGEGLLFDEGAPHEYLTIQGEVMASHRGLELRYSHAQIHQRILWLEDNTNGGIVHHAYGLRASALLQLHMDDASWETLNGILACQLGETNTWGDDVINFRYPIIEFAVFSIGVGVLNTNTLFWEVRTKY
jgi:hypothetical protein